MFITILMVGASLYFDPAEVSAAIQPVKIIVKSGDQIKKCRVTVKRE